MAKYSFEEKLRYNKERQSGSWFACGYVLGARLYEDYPRQNEEYKETVRDFIDTARDAATSLKGTDSDVAEYERGVMCGYRDAASERKARLKARTQERKQARAIDRFFTY